MRALYIVPVCFVGLVGCGLERPIAPQPLVSVIDDWRQAVLAEESQFLTGTTLEVASAEVAGDFGRLRWTEALAAEGSGTRGESMISVDLLAGGGEGRWGMTILGIYLPAFDDLEPGVTKRIPPFEASLIGCTGERIFDWDIDQSAESTTIYAELDPADEGLVNLTFEGEFDDGSTLNGRVTIERPVASNTP